MTTYRIISIIGIVLTIGGFVYAARKNQGMWKGFWNWFSQQTRQTLNALGHLGSLSFAEAMGILKQFLFLLTLLAVVLLALTGFLPVVIAGQHVAGILLMIHAIAAPVFAVSLALLILASAHTHRFLEEDWQAVHVIFNREKSSTLAQRSQFWQKVCFWLLTFFSIPVIASILFSMYPIFGTEGQEYLLQLHGYTTLVFTVIAVIYGYYTVTAFRST